MDESNIEMYSFLTTKGSVCASCVTFIGHYVAGKSKYCSNNSVVIFMQF